MNIRNLSEKFSKEKDFTSYWAHLKPEKNLDPQEEEKWKQNAAFLEDISTQNRVAITLWNAFSNRFVYVSDKWGILGGYETGQYMAEDGMLFWLNNIHPNHLEASLLMNERGVHFFNNHPGIPVKDVLISVTQHLKKKNGDYFQMLQQSIIVETDKTSKPLLVLSYLSDVSHIKRPDFADMVISYPQYNEIYFYDYENRTLQQKKPLSGKETDVLKLLSQGFDTKMIAHKLHLSPNTVDTHRRNLIKKTNCFDTTAVVTYARLTGLI